VLRYSTVYGERQHYRAANALYIIETLEKLAKGERPVILGDGTDTKHYVYAGDLARANAMAFEKDVSGVALNCSGHDDVVARLTARGMAYQSNLVAAIGLRQVFTMDPNGVLLELNFFGD